MPALFSNERGGSTIYLHNRGMLTATIASISATALVRCRSSFDNGVTWSSPVTVASLAYPAHPSICGPDADGRVFIFYITSVNTLAMKWSGDWGKTWNG